jgi:hypothetical protein
MATRKYQNLLFGIILIFHFSTPALSSGKKVHNPLTEIVACKDRIRLELDKDWESTLGINKAVLFLEPQDIEMGKTGNIYVVDSERKQLSIFESSGMRLRTIGKEGVKPGEFLYPVSLALDGQGHMIVGDEGWRGIQVLDSAGKAVAGFRITDSVFRTLALTHKNEIILPNIERTLKPSPLLFIYDYRGKILGKRGERGGGDSERAIFMKNQVCYSTDPQDNLYIAYLTRPLILKFSSDGAQSMELTYELPFKITEGSKDVDEFIDYEGSFVKSVSLDSQGNIYLVTQARPKSGKEKTIGGHVLRTDEDTFVKISTIKSGIKSESTDLYQLLVFESSGKIKASKQLDTFCDKIKVFGNSLFMIDTYVAHKIYKYKIFFE